MNIGLCHYRVGEIDGVSLEMNKWKHVLEHQGHKVYLVAGDKGNTEAFIIPELSLSDKMMQKVHFNAYYELKDFTKEEGLLDAIDTQAEIIENKLVKFIEHYSIDIIIPNNVLSLGHHLSAAIAIYRAARKKNIRLICHHHDFYWERAVFTKPTCRSVENILETYFPPLDQDILHCVINSIAKNKLKKKSGVDSIIVPNIFDFNRDDWIIDEYNSDFRERFNIKQTDLIFLQATRITDRKAIELAVDLVSLLSKKGYRDKLINKTLYNGNIFTLQSEILLVLPGLSGEAESATDYKTRLVKYAKKKNVRLIWCNDFVRDERTYNEKDQKIYSLWDLYANCDFITYPSIQEGWGNQFLEGLFARKPMVVFEYPVFLSDIKNIGFKYISLGEKFEVVENHLVKVDYNTMKNAVDKCLEILLNVNKYKELVRINFELGKEHYSFYTLNELLKKLIQ